MSKSTRSHHGKTSSRVRPQVPLENAATQGNGKQRKSAESVNPHMGLMERFSSRLTAMAGSTPAFIIAFALIITWAVTGPVFRYSEQWQLVVKHGDNDHHISDGISYSEVAE
ncbi:MAG: low affinity iron permease family protein [Chryseolinea sp.]